MVKQRFWQSSDDTLLMMHPLPAAQTVADAAAACGVCSVLGSCHGVIADLVSVKLR